MKRALGDTGEGLKYSKLFTPFWDRQYLTIIISDSCFTEGIPKDRSGEAICPVVHLGNCKSVDLHTCFYDSIDNRIDPLNLRWPLRWITSVIPSCLLGICPHLFLLNPSIAIFYSKDGWNCVSSPEVYSYPLCFTHFWVPEHKGWSPSSTLLVNLFPTFPNLVPYHHLDHIPHSATQAKHHLVICCVKDYITLALAA